MGVDHTIGIGYGFTVTEAQLRAWWDKFNDPEYYDGGDEALELATKGTGLSYFAAGSYYDRDPIEYAVIVDGTYQGSSDLSGFVEFTRPKIMAQQNIELVRTYQALVNEKDTPPLRWLVGGLWH